MITRLTPTLLIPLTLALACATFLNGCDKDKHASSQVLVRVNESEITVHQVESALRAAKVSNPTQEARDRLLEQMIDRELAVQEALRLELDQRPEMVLRVEELKRDALASTWGESISAQVKPPAEDDLQRYYQQHPELFSGRRVYRLQELTWPKQDGRVAEIWQQDKNRPGNDVVAALRSARLPMREQATQRATENLPMAVAAKLYHATGNDHVLFETPIALIAYRAVSFESAPITYETARPRIQKYLENTQSKEAVAATLAQLRKSARIDYLGAGAAKRTPPPAER